MNQATDMEELDEEEMLKRAIAMSLEENELVGEAEGYIKNQGPGDLQKKWSGQHVAIMIVIDSVISPGKVKEEKKVTEKELFSHQGPGDLLKNLQK